jgi:hypothetical protein
MNFCDRASVYTSEWTYVLAQLLPQRLKPACFLGCFGTADAMP